MDLQKLSQEAFATATAHGWHDTDLPDETYLMLIITEIAEAVQADRNDKYADVEIFNSYYEDKDDDYDVNGLMFKAYYDDFIKNSVEDELSDIIIRCLDLATLREISFGMAKEFIAENDGKMKETPFPVFMYYLCAFASCDDETLENKLNSIVAFIIIYCRQNGIGIDFFVEQKMRYNKLRPFKHGNKKY